MKKTLYILSILFFSSCQSKKANLDIKPRLRNITESVYASVTVSPLESYFSQTSQNGLIQEIFVTKGVQVSKGTPLFSIMPENAASRLIDAQLTLQQAEGKLSGKNNLLSSIKIELQNNNQQLALDSINYKRLERLWAQSIGTKADYEKAKMKFEASQNKYNISKINYYQSLENLETTYKKALNIVKNEGIALQDFTIRSEVSGMVYEIYKKVGETINSQEIFAEIGSSDSFLIEMNIDEIDIAKINLGDTAYITLEAYAKQAFKSIIYSIHPKKDPTTQTFLIEARFLQRPKKLYSGLSGEANILVSKRKNVITIPADYLMAGDIVITNMGKKEIQTGVKNMRFVEVLAGIDTSIVLKKPIE